MNKLCVKIRNVQNASLSTVFTVRRFSKTSDNRHTVQ